MTSTDLERRKELATDREAWTKQPWESWPAFEAFAVYREMGATRTIDRAADFLIETSHSQTKPDTLRRRLGGWSSKHHWVERCEAYELHMDQERLRTREEVQAEIVRQDLETAGKLLRFADTSLDFHLEGGVPLDAETIPRYVEAASRIRRLAGGLSTDNVRGALTITVQDLGRVVNAIVVGACEKGFVPPELQEDFVRWVMEEAA